MRPRQIPTGGPPAADSWVPLVGRPGSAAPAPPAGPAASRRAADAASAWSTVRADAAARVVAGLTTVTGDPTRVLATVRRGADVAVVTAAPVAAPPGWTSAPGGLRVPASLPTAALVGRVPEALPPADPAALALDTADGAVVTLYLDVVGRLGVSGRAAAPPALTALLAALLEAPLALAVDVITVGLPVAWLPLVAAGATGRLHALVGADDLGPAVAALAGGEDPVVVVVRGDLLEERAEATLDRAGVGVVVLDGPAGDGWRLGDAGPAVRLAPLGVEVML